MSRERERDFYRGINKALRKLMSICDMEGFFMVTDKWNLYC